MLTVIFGKCPGVIYKTPKYFDYVFENSWINNELSKRMILDVDKSIVIGDRLIESPIFGLISPKDLSGGVKTLMLIDNMPEKIFNGSQLGDNCAKWLLEIGKEKDIHVWFGHILDFDPKDKINIPIEVRVEWDNRSKSRIVNNMKEIMDIISSGEDVIQFFDDPEKLMRRR